jgi:hypothetical protein
VPRWRGGGSWVPMAVIDRFLMFTAHASIMADFGVYFRV